MDVQALRAALKVIARGVDDVIAALEDNPSPAASGSQQVRTLMMFDRPKGRGLSQGEASHAFKINGLDPRSMGAWVQRAWLVTRPDGLRYLADGGRKWLVDHGVQP